MPPNRGVIMEVDPRTLRVNPSRIQGADPARLQSQISHFGRAKDGMPPIWVARTSDDEFIILNGMTPQHESQSCLREQQFRLKSPSTGRGVEQICPRLENAYHE